MIPYEAERKRLCLPWVPGIEPDGVYHDTLTWIMDNQGKGVAKTTNQIRPTTFHRLRGDCEDITDFIIMACNNFHCMLLALEQAHEMLVCMKQGVGIENDFILRFESVIRKVIQNVEADKPAAIKGVANHLLNLGSEG